MLVEPPVHDVELWDSKLPTGVEHRLMDFVIQRRVDHREVAHPVIDLGDVILRVPRASILGEFHLTLTALFALRFAQGFNSVRSRGLVFSPEGGICLPVCVSHRTLGRTTLQSPEGGTFPPTPTDTSGRIQSRECLTYANTPLEMSFSDDGPIGHRCTSTRTPP